MSLAIPVRRRHVPDAHRLVADGVATVGGGKPLIDAHGQTPDGFCSGCDGLLDEVQKQSPMVHRRHPLEDAILALDDLRPKLIVGHDGVGHHRDLIDALFPDEHSCAPEGLRHRARVERHHRHAELEGFHERDAVPLVLAETEKQVGDFVVRDEVVVVDMTREHHVFEREVVDHPHQCLVVFLESDPLSHQKEPRVPIDVTLVEREDLDQVVEALVGNHAADEEKVGLVVVEHLEDHFVRRHLQPGRNRGGAEGRPSGGSRPLRAPSG